MQEGKEVASLDLEMESTIGRYCEAMYRVKRLYCYIFEKKRSMLQKIIF